MNMCKRCGRSVLMCQCPSRNIWTFLIALAIVLIICGALSGCRERTAEENEQSAKMLQAVADVIRTEVAKQPEEKTPAINPAEVGNPPIQLDDPKAKQHH